MSTLSKVRIDKWLWSVRAFKTRSLATDACKAGRVKIDGKSVKPSYMLQVGETVSAQKGAEKKVLKVVQLIEKRVGAKVAVTCYEDLSPPPIVSKHKPGSPAFYDFPIALRKPGDGRPTKRERRNLDKFYDLDVNPDTDFEE